MKKLFVLFAVAGFVLTSCGNNAQKEESVVEKAENAAQEVADSTAALVDSTVVEVEKAIQE